MIAKPRPRKQDSIGQWNGTAGSGHLAQSYIPTNSMGSGLRFEVLEEENSLEDVEISLNEGEEIQKSKGAPTDVIQPPQRPMEGHSTQYESLQHVEMVGARSSMTITNVNLDTVPVKEFVAKTVSSRVKIALR
ncbi:unnamed protein product [Linum trigynum]|uniref:Uncharacterized protein n=1 Tax=Linum trigynum TaxID=586398 RepID=A0AAV2E5K7_9ROSI